MSVSSSHFDYNEFLIHLCAQLCGSTATILQLNHVIGMEDDGSHPSLYWRSELLQNPLQKQGSTTTGSHTHQQAPINDNMNDENLPQQLVYMDILFTFDRVNISMQVGGLIMLDSRHGGGRDVIHGKAQFEDLKDVFAQLGYDLEAQDSSDKPAKLLAKALLTLKKTSDSQRSDVMINKTSNDHEEEEETISISLSVGTMEASFPLYQSSRPGADAATLSSSMIERMIRKIEATSIQSGNFNDSVIANDELTVNNLVTAIQQWKEQKREQEQAARAGAQSTSDTSSVAQSRLANNTLESKKTNSHLGLFGAKRKPTTAAHPSSKAPKKLARIRPLLSTQPKKKGFGFASSKDKK